MNNNVFLMLKRKKYYYREMVIPIALNMKSL